MTKPSPFAPVVGARLSRRRVLAGIGGAVATAGLSGIRGANSDTAAARPAGAPGATPAAAPTEEQETMDRQQLEKLVQFVHPEKPYGYLPGLDEGTTAALYGLDPEAYRELRARFDANARRAAEELLADPAFAERVDRLPFRPGATLVGLGESVTDDLQSWLEILRHLLALRRPRDGIRVVNMGIESTTTTQALLRIVPTLAQRPDWILCGLGAADAVRVGRQPTKTVVSLEETGRNLAELRRIAGEQSAARWVWITPPTVNEEIAAQYPPFQQIQFALRNDDLAAVADLVRAQDDPVVDVQAVFGRPAPAELVGSDGIHPSLAGQRAIAKALVERLAA